MDRRMWAYAVIIGILLGALVWFEYYPTSPMIATIGLPGPKANVGRECGNKYRGVVQNVRIPTRELVCRGGYAWAYLRDDQDVTIDALTRRIGHARRFWGLPDSASWQRTRDSVISTMQRLGGRRISCWRGPSSYDSVLHIRGAEYWKFPSYSVRFVSYRMPDDRQSNPWLLQLDGYSNLPSECVFDPWRHNR